MRGVTFSVAFFVAGVGGGVPPKTRFVRFVKNKISIFKNETHSGGAGVRRPSGGAPPLRGCTAPHGVPDDDCSGLTQAAKDDSAQTAPRQRPDRAQTEP